MKSEPGLDMFRCLSCPARFTSQRDLFFHLKAHYEPEVDDGAVGHEVVTYDYPADDDYGEEEAEQDLKPEIVMAPPAPKVQKISKSSLCSKYSWLNLSGEGDVQVIHSFAQRATVALGSLYPYFWYRGRLTYSYLESTDKWFITDGESWEGIPGNCARTDTGTPV